MNKLSSYNIFFVLLLLSLPWRVFAREIKKDSTKAKTHSIAIGASFDAGFSIKHEIYGWRHVDIFNPWGMQVIEVDSIQYSKGQVTELPTQPFLHQGMINLGYNYNNRFTIGFGLSYATFKQTFTGVKYGYPEVSDHFQVLNYRLSVAHYPIIKGRTYAGYGISIDRGIRTSIDSYYGEKSYRQLSGEVCIKRSLDKKEKVWVTAKAGWAYQVFKNSYPRVTFPNTFYTAYYIQKDHSFLISLGLQANLFSYASK